MSLTTSTPRNPPSGYAEPADPSRFDLLHVPVVGPLLRWRWARIVLQAPLLLVSVIMALHAFLGPDFAPKNLATLLTWVHFRGLVVLALLLGGNFFCMACPFMLPRELARRIGLARWNWPRALRHKGVAIGLFVAVLFVYEWRALWSDPWATGILIVTYFAAAFFVDLFFRKASFCKYVCPVGQFNFLASTVSPLEVAVRNPEACSSCRTKDCIAGSRAPATPAGGRPKIVQRGCELELFLPQKVGNLDCTFCLDCVHACPHDNLGIMARLPAEELAATGVRSGLGDIDQRKDWTALIVVFVFGAILNAFAMISPVYALEQAVARSTGFNSKLPVLAVLFAFALVIEPAVLLGGAAWLTRRATSGATSLWTIINRFSRSLVPLGFGVWLAHYGFHFFTGVLTVVPVVQYTMENALGRAVLGAPLWRLGGLPVAVVYPLELSFITIGMITASLVGWRIASDIAPERKTQAYAPWLFVILLLFVTACWTMSQPMDMRGTFVAS